MKNVRFISQKNLALAATFLLCATASAISQQSSPPQTPPSALASPAAEPLAFDAISIRPNNSGPTIDNGVSRVVTYIRFSSDGFEMVNANLKSLISAAYNVKDDAIVGGPNWIVSNHYDVNGKVTGSEGAAPPKLTSPRRKLMIRALLADRFKLAVHEESKEAAIYELTIAKSGVKLHEGTPAPTNTPMTFAPGQISFNAAPIAAIADVLARELHRPVIDKTGLTGKYDITLHWTEQMNLSDNSADTSAPSIFTAVEEQLGLKLTSAKGPVKTLVIDHVEPPTDN
jgi:uncharacterized protein (TIGR03435 family)